MFWEMLASSKPEAPASGPGLQASEHGKDPEIADRRPRAFKFGNTVLGISVTWMSVVNIYHSQLPECYVTTEYVPSEVRVQVQLNSNYTFNVQLGVNLDSKFGHVNCFVFKPSCRPLQCHCW